LLVTSRTIDEGRVRADARSLARRLPLAGVAYIPTSWYVRHMPAPATSARDKIVAAAIDLFRRNGYVATTVDEICAAAGVTKGAFFHHFESKEDLAET
jgi:TetR/AcrR family transcriptional repressor of nem operon